MKPQKGYWQRQVYMLSSIGFFYIIILAFFAIPLLGAFVVILIQGAMDFRYLILSAGFVCIIGLVVFAVKVVKKLFIKMSGDGVVVSDDVRRYMLSGKPVEISIFGGLLTFKVGQVKSSDQITSPQQDAALLPYETKRVAVSDVVKQLHELSLLKKSCAIDKDEYYLLKAMIIEASTKSDIPSEHDPS